MRWWSGHSAIDLTTVALLINGFATHAIVGDSTAGQVAAHLIVAYLIGWILYTFYSRNDRRELRCRFVLMTCAFLVVLGMAEGLAWLRLVDYRSVFATPPVPWWLSSQYIFDVEFLWRHPPGSHFAVRYHGNKQQYVCRPDYQPSQAYELRYDSNGFRNDDELHQADIAVVGDSFVEGAQVPHYILATSVLARIQGVRVANLGVTGYGPQQELLVVKRYAVGLRPNTLVWVFYEGNDLRDLNEYSRDRARFATLIERHTSLWQRSLIRNALEGIARHFHGCVPDPLLVKQHILLDVEGTVHPVHLLDAIQAISVAEEDALRQLKTILTDVYHLSRKHDMRLMIVFAPQEYRVYQGLPQIVMASNEVQRWEMNDLPARLRRMIRAISPDIQYLDLTPSLRQETYHGTAMFLLDDTHWTAAGHRVVGQAIAHALKEPERKRKKIVAHARTP